MTKQLQQTLRDSNVARWTALVIVSFTMMWGYFLTDAMSPLMTMLEVEMDWSSSDFGIFNWAYCWFNVFLFMLIFGGMILDKLGVRITGIATCALMVIGAFIKYYAVEFISPGPDAGYIFGIRTQVMIASLGYAIFAVGTENCGITVTKVIAKWFKGKEMALAMGTQVAVARLGTAMAMIVSPLIVKNFSMSTPLLFALVLIGIGLVAYCVFCVMDAKLDKQLIAEQNDEEDDTFHVSDLKLIITNKGFWLIALLCLMFYSAVFPFMKYATSLMENKYGMSNVWAGWIPALIPMGNLIMTPLFGGIYDRKGKGATIMIIGSAMLIGVHVLFALPVLNYWWFAAFIAIVLGVAFSLVPSAMWYSCSFRYGFGAAFFERPRRIFFVMYLPLLPFGVLAALRKLARLLAPKSRLLAPKSRFRESYLRQRLPNLRFRERRLREQRYRFFPLLFPKAPLRKASELLLRSSFLPLPF